MRRALVVASVVIGVGALPGRAAALGIGISVPTAALSNFGPGMTASGSGEVVVSGVLAPWVLKAADTTGNAGHLAAGAAGCTGSQPLTAGALTLSAHGLLATTTTAGPVSLGASAQTIATGIAADAVTVDYSIAVGKTEVMQSGCAYTTTVTFTVQ